MRTLMFGLLVLFSLNGCTVYTYYPVAPPAGHVHAHDGQGHCVDCGLYFYNGGYYTAAPYGWENHYGPAGPAHPPEHIHQHDGHGHCSGCEWFYYHRQWYDHQPAGWFEFYYHN